MTLLSRGLVERGLEVDLVLTRGRGPYLKDVPPEVRIIDLRARRIMWSLPGLIRYLRQERPRVLLSMLTTTNCVAVWGQALAGIGGRLVLNEQTVPTEAGAQARELRMRLLPRLMRWSYPRADAVTAISAGVACDVAHVTGLERDEIRVIYNPVVTPELMGRAAEPLRHPWFQPGEPPVVLAAGRLVPLKDFSTLLQAFALVRGATQARLMILGEGPERGQLEDLARALRIQDNVAFPGFVSNPYAFMSRSAVFALSSRWEGLGMVLIEAMACGIPVVSTDCPSGPREILEGGKWGRLVPLGSEAALGQAILDALADPGPDPRQRAAYFSVERAVDQYLDVLFPGGAAG